MTETHQFNHQFIYKWLFLPVMEWIQQTQAVVPVPLIRYGCPILIIGCFLGVFEHSVWLKQRTIGYVYLLSVLTGYLVGALLPVNNEDVAIIGGVFAPTFYSLLVMLLGVARVLKLPYGGRSNLGRRDRLPGNFLTSLLKGGLSGCRGGVLGATVGSLISFAAITLASLLALSPIDLSNPEAYRTLIRVSLNSGIYWFGGLGIGLGLLSGLSLLNLRWMSEKLLIHAVIWSAIAHRWVNKLLGLSPLRRLIPRLKSDSQPDADSAAALLRPGEFEVTETGKTLTLRYRTYRTLDWVWIGFNGLYDSFTLLLTAIAIWRGTWISMSWAIGMVLFLAIFWTWNSLTRLLNSTVIVLNPLLLIRHDAPLLSLAYPVRIPLEDISGIRASAVCREGAGKSWATYPEYQVEAFLSNGGKIPLLQQLDCWEEALFVEDRIADFRAQQNF